MPPDPHKDIVAALLIILPPDTIDVARRIAREARRIAKEVGQPLPDFADVASLLLAQPDPRQAYGDAAEEGIFADLTGG